MGTLRLRTGEEITFDSILDEQWTYPAEVTEYPVENNDAANDHRQPMSNRLTLRAIITDDPFPAQSAVSPLADDTSRPRSVEGELLLHRLADTAEPITYLSGRMGARGPFWVRNIDFKIEQKRSITFTIEMTEIRFALSETVSLPPEVVPRPNGGLTGQFTGQPEDEEEGSETELGDRSFARKFGNFLFGGENENVIEQSGAGPRKGSGGSAGLQFITEL